MENIFQPLNLLIAGGLVLTVGDIIMKAWVKSNSPYVFIGGLLVYLIGLIFLAYSYRHENIAVASTLIVIFNIVSLLLVSWFFFHEKLNFVQIIGILFAVLAVVMLKVA